MVTSSKMSLKVRPATKQDLPQVRDIYEYYVLNTVISFLSQAPPLDYVTSRYEESIARRLPYLVAVDDSSEEESVLAYAVSTTSRDSFRRFLSLHSLSLQAPGNAIVFAGRVISATALPPSLPVPAH